ncbi:tetraspanin family protein [Artemisia annua]|uniref:Tetraspanin family protein n=1 Tax=Artemisia annua TaxID=35608 RepID=A0A2U1NSA8_ARTAN|nr:tetraspanin family protein [Artemisia annua]
MLTTFVQTDFFLTIRWITMDDYKYRDDSWPAILLIAVMMVLPLTILVIGIYDDAEPIYYSMEDQERFGGCYLPMFTKEYQIKFYVKSEDLFNQRYPPGTPAQADIEDEIHTKYVDRVQADCEYELYWYSRLPDFSTTFCDKFQSFGKYKEEIPVDKTGDFDMIYRFLEKNWKICRWVALGAVVLQALVFLLACVVRAANSPSDYDSDDEYIAGPRQQRQPLISRQPAPATGIPVTGTLDSRPSRNDAWSTRMREKYGLDTAEFTIVWITHMFVVRPVLLQERIGIYDDVEPIYYSMEDQERFGGCYLPMFTKEYQIKFYVKSEDVFNQRYPPGTPARADIEDEIHTKYLDRVQADCEYELYWYSRLPDFSTNFCDKFQSFGKYKEVGIHQVLQHPDFAPFLERKHLKDGINQVLQRPDFPAFLKES